MMHGIFLLSYPNSPDKIQEESGKILIHKTIVFIIFKLSMIISPKDILDEFIFL